jgi:hypothetical protein
MSCKGLHCNGCGDGGGGAVALAVVVVLILIAAIAKPAEQAARTAGHVLADVVTVVLTAVIVLAVAGITAALGWAGFRVYWWRVRKLAQQSRSAAVSTASWRAEVISPEPQAIYPPRPRLDAEAVSGPGARTAEPSNLLT